MLCSAYTESGDLVTGDTSGSLFLWPRGQQKITSAAVGAHDGGLFALALYKDAGGNARLLSGGKDRKIVQWDAGLARLSELVVCSLDCLFKYGTCALGETNCMFSSKVSAPMTCVCRLESSTVRFGH